MQQHLLDLVSAREGHFRLESGHHGGIWLDLDPLFLSPARVQPLVSELAWRLSQYNIGAVCGPLTGGAFLAQSLAAALGIDFFSPSASCQPNLLPFTPSATAFRPRSAAACRTNLWLL